MPYPPFRREIEQETYEHPTQGHKTGSDTYTYWIASSRPVMVDTPDFDYYKAKGYYPPMHPYTAKSGWYESPMYNCIKLPYGWPAYNNVLGLCGTRIISGAYNGRLSTYGSGYASLYNSVNGTAVRKFYDRVGNNDFQALVTAAELPKTMQLIGDTARRLANGFRSLKRGDVGGLTKALGLETGRHSRSLSRRANNARRSKGGLSDFAAGAWLEVKYGWKPLLSDIQAAAEATALGWQVEPADVVIRSAASKSVDPYYVSGYASELTVTGNASVSVSYTCKYKILDQSTRNLQGLGLLDLGSVAWELIPYSFVVDWFIPIGDWIAAQNALAGLQFVEGCQTIKSKVDGRAVVHKVGSFPVDDMTIEVHDHGIQRIKLNSSPNINAIVTLSNWKEKLNFDKAVTGIALLASAFGRR